MINSVIFDMDGVLIDSQPIHFKSDIMTIEKFGGIATENDIIKFAGTTNKLRFKLYKEAFGLNGEIEEMINERERITAELFDSEELIAVKGIKELLADLKQNGIKTAVASSSPYVLIYKVLDRTGIRQYFDYVLSGEDVKNGKPEPDVFIKAAELINSEPKNCVVIEDSKNGVQSGISAEMKVIGYYNPTSGEQDISKATVVIDDFRKIDSKYITSL